MVHGRCARDGPGEVTTGCLPLLWHEEGFQQVEIYRLRNVVRQEDSMPIFTRSFRYRSAFDGPMSPGTGRLELLAESMPRAKDGMLQRIRTTSALWG